jgi:hypothetical protein
MLEGEREMNVRWFGSRVLWGGLLIAAGILFLLQNLNVIRFAEIIWSILFALGGIFMLSFFIADRNNWWALIPSIVLFNLGLMVALDTIFPRFSDTVGGALFLGGIGLSFWLIYLIRREFWWAIIPGGALFTLAAVVVAASLGYEAESGGVLFLGLGLTFGLLAVLPTPEGRLTWAWIPGLALLIMGVMVIGAAANLINFLWPAALIVVGIFLVYRTLFARRTQ